MSNLRHALQMASAAIRANLLPGLLLQALMLVFLSAYVAHEGTRVFLAEMARVKSEAGYFFAFVSYAMAAGFFPEVLSIGFFQKGRPTRENLWRFLTAAPAWGCLGVLIDFFYRCQIGWFGTGHDLATICFKVVADQFVFSPFLSNPLIIAWLIWRDQGFRLSARKDIFYAGFFMERVFPVQVSGWIVWIPGVALVYFMPPLLQIPIAALITTFWVLIFTTVGKARAKRT